MRYPFLVSLTLLARTEYRHAADTTVLDVAVVTGDMFDGPYLDRLGGGELRVDQHQWRVGVVRSPWHQSAANPGSRMATNPSA